MAICIFNNINIIKNGHESELSLPTSLGKTPVMRIANLYELLWLKAYGTRKPFILVGRQGGMVRNMVVKYGEVLTAMLVVTHFEWRGIYGNNEDSLARLKENQFPFAWIFGNSDEYLHYITNTINFHTVEQMSASLERLIKDLTKK